ncbi:MAG: hypothetical protein E7666_05490 [Ruminococcaceae bacterium]|nr:hypothetical protein [Oscillospiraceae bacterium]
MMIWRTIMKKLLAMLLAATMLLCLVACSDKNDNDKNDLKDYEVEEIIITYVVTENGDTFHFESVDSETVAITKYEGPDTPHAVEIPAVLNEKKVVAIADTAFYYSSQITALTFPDTLTTIGSFAFAGCSGLTELNIPATVSTIGEAAFYGCTALTKVTFAQTSSLKNIEQRTFDSCTALTAISIPAYIETIGTGAFLGCTKLASITIAEGCQIIGAQAFQNCTELASLKLPASVASIGKFAFAGSENLYMDGVEYPADSYAESYIKNMKLEETAPPVEDEE